MYAVLDIGLNSSTEFALRYLAGSSQFGPAVGGILRHFPRVDARMEMSGMMPRQESSRRCGMSFLSGLYAKHAALTGTPREYRPCPIGWKARSETRILDWAKLQADRN